MNCWDDAQAQGVITARLLFHPLWPVSDHNSLPCFSEPLLVTWCSQSDKTPVLKV